MSVLNEPVLILNRNWHPTTFLPVQTAIVTVMRDMGSVLDTENYLLLSFDEWAKTTPKEARWIKTPSGQIPAPDVVILKKFGEVPQRKVCFNRPNLHRRDDYVCQYCGAALPERKLTIEHVVPRSKGGATDWLNCVSACGDCNSRKADRTPVEAGMKLKKTPAKPSWKPHLAIPRGKVIRPSWTPFLEKVS